MNAVIENGPEVERDDLLGIETGDGNLGPDLEIEREGKLLCTG